MRSLMVYGLRTISSAHRCDLTEGQGMDFDCSSYHTGINILHVDLSLTIYFLVVSSFSALL